MDKIEIDKMIDLHQKWLNNEEGGVRAIFSGLDLDGYDFRGVTLSQAIFHACGLNGANFRGADLQGVEFSHSACHGTNFRDANLHKAIFNYTYLYGTIFINANLSDALFDGYVEGGGIDFRYANVTNIHLTRIHAPLCERVTMHTPGIENLVDVYPLACPETGSFIAYKQLDHHIIAKLLIPEDARRSSAFGRKCRADKAQVLGLFNYDGTPAAVAVGFSHHDPDFAYPIGETVSVPDFNPDRWEECSTGIHFFLTFREAVNY